MVGPKSDEFLLKAQQAAAGPPWYTNSSSLVRRPSLCLSVPLSSVKTSPYSKRLIGKKSQKLFLGNCAKGTKSIREEEQILPKVI